MWQENLLNNLIVFFVLGSIIAIIYLKVAKKTLTESIRDIRGGFADE